jgi:hypothetical protein
MSKSVLGSLRRRLRRAATACSRVAARASLLRRDRGWRSRRRRFRPERCLSSAQTVISVGRVPVAHRPCARVVRRDARSMTSFARLGKATSRSDYRPRVTKRASGSKFPRKRIDHNNIRHRAPPDIRLTRLPKLTALTLKPGGLGNGDSPQQPSLERRRASNPEWFTTASTLHRYCGPRRVRCHLFVQQIHILPGDHRPAISDVHYFWGTPQAPAASPAPLHSFSRQSIACCQRFEILR